MLVGYSGYSCLPEVLKDCGTRVLTCVPACRHQLDEAVRKARLLHRCTGWGSVPACARSMLKRSRCQSQPAAAGDGRDGPSSPAHARLRRACLTGCAGGRKPSTTTFVITCPHVHVVYDTCACCTTRVHAVRHVCMLYETCACCTTRVHVVRHMDHVVRHVCTVYATSACYPTRGVCDMC